MNTERDIDAIQTWEHGEEGRRFGGVSRRREPPSICRECGDEYPDRPFMDGTCGRVECREKAAGR